MTLAEAAQWMQVVGPVFAAVGVYVGVRVDLARLHERVNYAHERIDELMKGRA